MAAPAGTQQSRLPPVTELQKLSGPQLAHVLDVLFEPSPMLRAVCFPLFTVREVPDYSTLISTVQSTLMTLAGSTAGDDQQVLEAVLAAHPRLGQKKVDSDLSKGEQAQLQGEGEMLQKLNEEYESKFPGLRYVVFVNGRGRDVITDDMKSRISRNDRYCEKRDNINAMCEIANDRAKKLTAE